MSTIQENSARQLEENKEKNIEHKRKYTEEKGKGEVEESILE